MRFLMCRTILLLMLVQLMTGCGQNFISSDDAENVSSRSVVSADVDEDYSVVSSGISLDDGFKDVSSKNKYKAPYNQTYYFSFDSNQLSDADMRSVNVQAEYLLSHPDAAVMIAGHTDARGSREYNVALGERRALSVVNILKLHNVPASQIQRVSYGKEKLVAYGNLERDHQQNRRVEFQYKKFG